MEERHKTPPPIKPSSLLLVYFSPSPGPHGELVLNGVDAVADGGENDEQDYDDDCDDDVALDHGCDGGWWRRTPRFLCGRWIGESGGRRGSD